MTNALDDTLDALYPQHSRESGTYHLLREVLPRLHPSAAQPLAAAISAERWDRVGWMRMRDGRVYPLTQGKFPHRTGEAVAEVVSGQEALAALA